MAKRYEWRELTDTGLLLEPPKAGPHYDKHCINNWRGFDTEDEAVAAYNQFYKDHQYAVNSELVLVTIYTPEVPHGSD